MAQIVLGQVPYPLEHPMVRATRNALNLQIYTSAAILHLRPNPYLLCFVRNTLFLLATVLPVYAIAAVLGRRALLAHLAAVFVLLAVHEEFDGCKRLVTWPHFFSTGHVGRGYAMLTFAALLAGWWRTGLGMLGLMPCVHVAHMPVVLGFAVLRGAHAWRLQRKALIRGVVPLALGLAVCGGIWLSKNLIAVPEPSTGPYASRADPRPIWEGFLAQDVHRALPGGPVKYGNSFFVLGAALILCAMAARFEWHRMKRLGPWCWVMVFVIGCACAVWGIMAIHIALGQRVPYMFIAWMPYRFTNHAATVLLAAMPVFLAGLRRDRGLDTTGIAWLAIIPIYAVAAPCLDGLVPEPLYTRYVDGGAFLLFILCGAAAWRLIAAMQGDRAGRRGASVALVTGAGALATYHQFGPAMVGVGFVCGAALDRVAGRDMPADASRARDHRMSPALTAMLVLGVAVLALHQWAGRVVLPISPMDAEIQRLAQAESLFLVAPPDQYGLQSRTGQRVMVDGPLAPWIPYMPSLGPSIQKIHWDLYGIRWDGPVPQPWTEVWRDRSAGDWQRLAETYGFNAVVAPASVPLQLTPVLEARGVSGYLERLYLLRNDERL